jgi:hypothetical protein
MQRSRTSHRSSAVRRATRTARALAPTVDAHIIRLAALAAAMLLLLMLSAMRADAMTRQKTGGDSVTTLPVEMATAPSPRLTPDDVVAIVLGALARNDQPTKDHGISVTFAFSSPANRAFIGPIESFADLVRDDTYRPLLNHRHASRGPAHVNGDRATVRVVITTAGGERVAYLFALSLQNEGTYKGCWMTDGVTREPPSPLAGMRFASRTTAPFAGV